jgi:predicted amidohydrolase
MSDVPSEVIGSWSRRDDGVIVVREVDGDAPAAGHLRVAGAQYGVTTDVEANLALALRFIAIAADEGAEVVVLPEFGNHVSWYDDREHARRMAVTLDGPFVGAVADAARERGVGHGQRRGRQDDGRTTGTNVLCSPAGDVVASSDKQVLMGSERLHLDDAVGLGPVIDTPVARFGMYSCMDGVINETPRGLALRGAQVLLNSLNSFALDEASLHIPVRAPENRVWIVAANKSARSCPRHHRDRESGVGAARPAPRWGSRRSSPRRRVVVRARGGLAVVVADIDVAEADRKTRPDGTDVYASRRPELRAVGRRAARAHHAQRGRGRHHRRGGADDDLDVPWPSCARRSRTASLVAAGAGGSATACCPATASLLAAAPARADEVVRR